MKAKRTVLAFFALLLCVSAAHRVRAGDSNADTDKTSSEIDVGGFAGETSGGWTCGPRGTLHYGGLGIAGSVSQRSPKSKDGRGATGRIATTVEWQSTTIHPDPASGNTQPTEQGPPDLVAIGAQARAGYHWSFISIEGGGGLFQGYNNAHDQLPVLAIYPAVEMTVGKLNSLYGVAGGGASVLGTVSRPGFYFGGGMISEGGWQGDLRAGIYRQGPAALHSAGLRLDLMGRAPITDWMWLRAGGSLGFPEDKNRLDFEGSLGMVFGL